MRFLAGAMVASTLLASGAALAVPEKKLEPTFKHLGHIHGYLITPSGEGLRGMIVLCTADGKKMTFHNSWRERKGRFDIDNLLPGKYVLKVDTIGPEIGELEAPAPLTVEVLPDKVIRPHLVAR